MCSPLFYTGFNAIAAGIVHALGTPAKDGLCFASTAPWSESFGFLSRKCDATYGYFLKQLRGTSTCLNRASCSVPTNGCCSSKMGANAK